MASVASVKYHLKEFAKAVIQGDDKNADIHYNQLNGSASSNGSPDERCLFYLLSALQSRRLPTGSEVKPKDSDEHLDAMYMFYDSKPSHKLPLVASNLTILEATQGRNEIHVLDFEMGSHHLQLKKEMAARRSSVRLKLTLFPQFSVFSDQRIKKFEEYYKRVADAFKINFQFRTKNCALNALSRQRLDIDDKEILSVNIPYKLHGIPDQTSGSNIDLQGCLLTKVRGLLPTVVTMSKWEMEGNAVPLKRRVIECFDYFRNVLDMMEPADYNMESAVAERLKHIVMCDGPGRRVRFEVFSKWWGKMRFAGFIPMPRSSSIEERLRNECNTETLLKATSILNDEPVRVDMTNLDSNTYVFHWKEQDMTSFSAWKLMD